MLMRIFVIVIFSVNALFATDCVGDCSENSDTPPTWMIHGTATQGFAGYEKSKAVFGYDQLNFIMNTQNKSTPIPSEPYDIADYHESYLPPKNLRDAWDAAYENNDMVLAHGFSAGRLNLILNAYFSEILGVKPTELSAAQTLNLAPFSVLGFRNIVSSCLIDLKRNASLAFYQVGFLFKVPKECIYAYSNDDIFSPSEGQLSAQEIRSSIACRLNTKYSQEALLEMLTAAQRQEYFDLGYGNAPESTICNKPFRDVRILFPELLKKNSALNNLPKMIQYEWDNFTPQGLLDSTAARAAPYNEVAFVPRVSNPHKEARIVGVYYTPHLTGFGMAEPHAKYAALKNPLTRDETIECLRSMAQKMGVPLIELH